LLIDGAVLGMGIVLADIFPLRDKLAILGLLIAGVIIFYLFWSHRP
jgi:hypothetical protein